VCRPVDGILQPQANEAVKVCYFPLHALPLGLFPWYRSLLQHDVLSTTPRPLQRTQHLGTRTVLHCLLLDLGSRLGILP
jgi:hypothetical protein